MLPPLLALPIDILVSILLLLRAEDVLVVSQICRVLHDLALNDYVWHQLSLPQVISDLPLDLEPYVDRRNLPGPALKAIVTRALRVDHNWRRPNPRIKKLTRLVDTLPDNVLQMQFVGSRWLVILRRSSLFIWRVADSDTKQAYRAACIDITRPVVPLKFAAAMQRGGREILIALISSTASGTTLSAYSVFVRHDGFSLPAPRSMCSIYKPKSEGQFHEIHLCGHTIAAAIPQFVNSVLSPTAYRILFVNALTGVQSLVDPGLPEQFTQLHFKLYANQLVLVGVRNQTTLVVRTHDLPVKATSLTPPTAEYETQTICDLDCHLSADSTHNLSHISSISFHSLVRRADDYIFHFPLGGGTGTKPSCVYRFSTHTSASAEIVCLGETGCRAVWLERRWTSDEYTLMKATFSPHGRKPVVVEPLLARHLALPFELHMCQSLAFEESTGRVCLAVHTGELYILEF
ncbi:hypothetical protein C8R43DRAFT_980378 [Mycena crocata]|nr:hypothetical protein C8R43DRAFT_980378 [Mycena crocata]